MGSSPPLSPTRQDGQHHQHHHHERDPTEQTPLLTASTDTIVASETDTLIVNGAKKPSSIAPSEKPLPKMQIFLLCYARMTEPIAFFSIFPFIADMLHRVGNMPKSDVGFYSGLIESLFSATQMLVLIFWGRLADRLGRKPVLLYSMSGMIVGPVLFCMSTSLWQMILFRCLTGVFSGSGLIIRTMISEHSTPETQARAFSWFAFAGNVGIFIGPLVGGPLSDPIRQYPGLFKGIDFFERYPYALAGMAVAAISLTSAITSALFLEETLPKEDDGPGANGSGPGGQPHPERSSMWELLKAPGVGAVLWVYGHVMFLAFAFTAISPVAVYIPVELGGLELGPSMISAFMASQGASQALWLLLAFPYLHRRMGTKGVMRACGAAYPVFFVGYIALNLLLREGGPHAKAAFWVLAVVVVFIGPGVSMCFTSAQLALNDVAPDTHVLGTLNAIALTGSSAIRSVVPGVATAVYALGVHNQILGGHLAWVILIPCSAALAVCARWLPEGRKPRQATTDEEEE